MKIMKKILLLSVLSGTILINPYAIADDSIKYWDYRAANTPINYSYINLELGDKSVDNLDESLLVVRVSGQTLLNESFIFKVGYQAEIYDETISGEEISFQDNLLNMGVGWRYPIFESTDIELDGHLLYNWNDGELNNDVKQSDIGYRAGAAIHYGFGDSFDTSLGLRYESIDNNDITSAELKLTKYITRYVGVGINGSLSDSNSELGDVTYIGLHLNLAFY